MQTRVLALVADDSVDWMTAIAIAGDAEKPTVVRDPNQTVASCPAPMQARVSLVPLCEERSVKPDWVPDFAISADDLWKNLNRFEQSVADGNHPAIAIAMLCSK